MNRLFLLPLFLLAGCDWVFDTLTPEPTKAELIRAIDQIASRCSTPPGWIRPMGDNGIVLGAGPIERNEDVECVLAEVEKLPFKVTLGFIGNEAYVGNAQ